MRIEGNGWEVTAEAEVLSSGWVMRVTPDVVPKELGRFTAGGLGKVVLHPSFPYKSFCLFALRQRSTC